jgi:hypothetical protein
MKPNTISSHILPTSATMVGVCMTVLSIAKLIEGQRGLVIIDELMAFDGLVFLLSAGLSYQSIRSLKLQEKFETLADMVFMTGLILMTISAFIFAYEIY